MLMIKPENLNEKDLLVNLWIHETFRVFRDRLVDQNDRDKFNNLCHTILKSYLDMEWEQKDYVDVLFGDYEGNEGYMKLSEINVLIPRLNECIELYNATNPSQMNLVFFSDCIAHLTRIARVLR